MSWQLVKQAIARDLESHAKLVLIVVAEAASAKNGNCCWYSVETIARLASLSVRSVQNKLKVLEAEGDLTREYRTGESNRYHVHPRSSCAPAKSAEAQSLRETPANRGTTLRKSCRETIKNQKRNRSERPVGEIAKDVLTKVKVRERSVCEDPSAIADGIRSLRGIIAP